MRAAQTAARLFVKKTDTFFGIGLSELAFRRLVLGLLGLLTLSGLAMLAASLPKLLH